MGAMRVTSMPLSGSVGLWQIADYFGGMKLLGIEVFIKVFPLYDLIAKRLRPYKYIYPLMRF